MENIFIFIGYSSLLGVGLAMDAFSVSIANALNDLNMSKNKSNKIALTFGFFQVIMPLIGWFCVHTMVTLFNSFSKFIPWIALILLLYIGGKMILESFKNNEPEPVKSNELIIQGIATSIDALSVGFTISNYSTLEAIFSSLIIGVVTFVICKIGLKIGNKVGNKFSSKSSLVGGLILVFIGIEIFIKGI